MDCSPKTKKAQNFHSALFCRTEDEAAKRIDFQKKIIGESNLLLLGYNYREYHMKNDWIYLLAFAGFLGLNGCASNATDSGGVATLAPRHEKNISTLGVSDSSITETASGSKVYREANFTWQDSLGIEHSLSELLGKVVVINLWATWCEPCRKELTYLSNIAKINPSDSVVLIGVSIDAKSSAFEDVKGFMSTYDMGYQQIVDTHAHIYYNYEIQDPGITIPKTFIIDKNGFIRYKITGEVPSQNYLQNLIDKTK